MPTNNNTNTSQPAATPIAEDTPAHASCPPETNTISHSWRSRPQDRDLPVNGELSTNAISIARSPASSSLNHLQNDVLVESAPDASMKQMAGSEEEPAPGRLSPDSERSSCSGGGETARVTTPSTSSLLRYEFSSIRVIRTVGIHIKYFVRLTFRSFYPTIPPHFYAPAAGSSVLNSRIVGRTTSMWKSSMWIWRSHISVAIFVYKARFDAV